MRFSNGLIAHEKRCRVMKWPATSFISIDKSDEQSGIADALVKLIDNFKSLGDKTRFEDEVLRRVTGDRQLRGDYEIGAGGGQALVSV